MQASDEHPVDATSKDAQILRGSLRELSHRLHQGTRCNHVHHEDFAEEPVPAQSSICRCVQGHGKPFKSLCTTCPATVSAAFLTSHGTRRGPARRHTRHNVSACWTGLHMRTERSVSACSTGTCTQAQPPTNNPRSQTRRRPKRQERRPCVQHLKTAPGHLAVSDGEEWR